MQRPFFRICCLLVFVILTTPTYVKCKTLGMLHFLEADKPTHEFDHLEVTASIEKKLQKPDKIALHDNKPQAAERKKFLLNSVKRHVLSSLLFLFAGLFGMVIWAEFLEPRLRKKKLSRE